MVDKPKPKRSARSGWLSIALVFGGAILFGALILPRVSGVLVGNPAPDFALNVIHGGEPSGRIRLSEQRGKLLLLDFWASWCGPCRQQTHVLDAVRRRYQDTDLVIVGVNVNDAPEAARAYLEQVKPPWVVVEDSEGSAAGAYGARTLPTVVAIDRDGKVFAVRRRFVPERELVAIIDGMVGR